MRAERAKHNADVIARILRLDGSKATDIVTADDTCILFLVCSGSCTLISGEVEYSLNPGCTVLLGAGVGGRLEKTSHNLPDMIGCAFPLTLPSELRGLLQKDFAKRLSVETPTILHGSVKWNSRLRTLLELMYASQNEPDYPALGYLWLVLRYTEQQYAAESRVNLSGNETIEQVCVYLADNYTQRLTLGEIATKFYFSPYYLSHLFRRVTGQSIVDYINARRIEAAQRLLEQTDLSISEVAEQTGFATPVHFRRVFREFMGAGPLQYRKAHKTE